MTVVRVWIPVAILVAGVVIVIVRGGDETSLEGAAALWGAGLSVALLNWLHRMGVSGDSARIREDEARAYFTRHGRWPDEAEAPPRAETRPRAKPPHRAQAPHRYVPPRQGS